MRRLFASSLALGALALGARPLAADDSVFGIRGLGILGRPHSAQSASAGGGFALFDPEGGSNPAALARWRGVSGWAVGSASRRRFDSGTGEATLTSTRFPLVGFATVVGQRLYVGVAISDYLDRTWSVSGVDTLTPRGSPVQVTDKSKSIGGVSDLRFAAAYRLSPALAVGAGVHALTGSTRLEVTREFDDATYQGFRDVAVTDFSGFGLSLGAVLTARPNLQVGGTLRINSGLKAKSTSGARATVALPVELGFGAHYTPAPGLVLASSVGYAPWSRAADALGAAGAARARSVWSVGAGVDVEAIRLGSSRIPLRLGYRWRQLPFPVGGAALGEHAFSGGFGLVLAGGRTTLDAGVEKGTRAAGAQSESFTTGFVGITVRP
mgnify:CR=1 FL=1